MSFQRFQSTLTCAYVTHRLVRFTESSRVSYNNTIHKRCRVKSHQRNHSKLSCLGQHGNASEEAYSPPDAYQMSEEREQTDEGDIRHTHPIPPATLEVSKNNRLNTAEESLAQNTNVSDEEDGEAICHEHVPKVGSGSAKLSFEDEGHLDSSQPVSNHCQLLSSRKPNPYNRTQNAVQLETADTVVSSRSKVDLSYFNVRKREIAIPSNKKADTPRAQSTVFRKNAGLRQIVAHYMEYVEPLVTQFVYGMVSSGKLDLQLQASFPEHILRVLRQQGYDIEDVMSWSWIMSSDSSDVSIRRLVTYSKHARSDKHHFVPLFVPLQLLRASHISAATLNLLLEEIEADLQIDNRWRNESGSVLLIRLLRHARMVDVSQFERISDIAARILPFETRGDAHEDAQRLTHFYNRFLSLLALPVARHPYLSTGIQQRAQLRIVRSMLSSKLSIVLNREGYRALARIQLMHKKTTDEQNWSSAKGPSWPPWRRDEIGIDAKTEYAGRQSRTSKVLRRLLEAGYGPASMEHEAQILSGWDSDKSPTVQARRIMKRPPFSWLKSMFASGDSQLSAVDHNVWAARVAATRSIREAWACFYSYMEATTDQKRELRVYHEMFSKIFARLQRSDQTSVPSPGDGKEVFADPVSTRDHIYVPREPPSLDELYAQMLQDGIRPAGRLLAALIDSARTLRRALDYVAESSLGDVKKDVLLHPENYPGYAIRNLYATIPDYLLASYMGVLAKRFPHGEVSLYLPSSHSIEERGTHTTAMIRPLRYGLTLLQTWETRYLPAYHAVLEGICTQSKVRRQADESASSRKHSTLELWKMAKHTLHLLEVRDLCPDLICFRKLVILFRNIMVRAPSQFGNHAADFTDACETLRSTFTRAINGSNTLNQSLISGKELKIGAQPYWKDIEHVILISGMIRNFPVITEILRWMSEFEDDLDFVSESGYKMQRLMCAARVSLEQSWNKDKSRGASQQQIQQSMKYAEKWGWPDDIDVNEFLQLHRPWVEGIRAATKALSN